MVGFKSSPNSSIRLQVRPAQSASGGDLSQQLPLAGMSVCSSTPGSDGSLYLASSTDAGIRRLTPVPFLLQVNLAPVYPRPSQTSSPKSTF